MQINSSHTQISNTLRTSHPEFYDKKKDYDLYFHRNLSNQDTLQEGFFFTDKLIDQTYTQ
jgi:hypothetical protein